MTLPSPATHVIKSLDRVLQSNVAPHGIIVDYNFEQKSLSENKHELY